ncbi:maleylpyruvate isomerase family mycothiol-dependent enzyme [Nocardiopsis listeri]|uniref:maleylpyruvate isomerase family mycothiol-dependent enzyme n=1 Tax=Nocardiopsis listeri TaxID=53440 RepID=UPI00082FD5FD|nr:maleylpyruvate isomerase family mycothiol-dependent enzyme [Nocardiopsis listeri]
MDSALIYQQAQDRLVALAAGLDEASLATVVPACPAWDVRQTYAHMAGLCVEVVQGLVAPPASDEVTARQVADRADKRIDELTAEWVEGAPALLELMRTRTRLRYSLPALDTWHHENDIRGALGMQPQTEGADQLAAFVLGGLARGWPADRPSVHVKAADTGQEWRLGEGDAEKGADLGLSASAFELARAITGRRSLAQIRALDWDGDPAGVAHLLPALPAPEGDLTV